MTTYSLSHASDRRNGQLGEAVAPIDERAREIFRVSEHRCQEAGSCASQKASKPSAMTVCPASLGCTPSSRNKAPAYAEGALACGHITELIESFVLELAVSASGMDYEAIRNEVVAPSDYGDAELEWMEALLAGMRDHCPPEALILESAFLEEGSGGRREITVEDLMVSNTLSDWHCSCFSAWGETSATGGLIYARNLDYTVDARAAVQRYQIVKLAKRLEFNCLTLPWGSGAARIGRTRLLTQSSTSCRWFQGYPRAEWLTMSFSGD